MRHSGKEKYKVLYYKDVDKIDFERIDKFKVGKIKLTIENRLTVAPNFYGMQLRRSLKGYWKLRIEDYRVIYQISGTTVLVYIIGHRKEVYELAKRRLGLI